MRIKIPKKIIFASSLSLLGGIANLVLLLVIYTNPVFTPEFKIFGGIIVMIILFSIPVLYLILVLREMFQIKRHVKINNGDEILDYFKQKNRILLIYMFFSWYLFLQTFVKEYILEFYV